MPLQRLIRSSTPMKSSEPNRRNLLLGAMAAPVLFALPRPLVALTTDEASRVIGQLVSEVNAIINSGKPEQAMYNDFERILWRYGDLPIIARSTLGVTWRNISDAQRRAFTDQFMKAVLADPLPPDEKKSDSKASVYAMAALYTGEQIERGNARLRNALKLYAGDDGKLTRERRLGPTVSRLEVELPVDPTISRRQEIEDPPRLVVIRES